MGVITAAVNNELIGVGLVLVGVAVFVVLLVKVIYYFTEKTLRPIAEGIGGRIERDGIKGPRVVVPLKTGNGIVTISQGSQYSPPFLNLYLEHEIGFMLSISKENFATRGLEKLGIGHEVRVNDPIFDDKYRIKSSDEMRALNLLSDHRIRQAVDEIFERRYSQILAKKGLVLARLYNYKKTDLEPESVRAVFDALLTLVG